MFLRKFTVVIIFLTFLIITSSTVMAETKEEFYRKGLVFAGQGKFEEALSCYDEALKLDSDYLEVLLAKGKLLNTFGKEEEAEECFVRIMEIVPYNANSWYMQAEVLMEVFEYEDALNCCNKAIAKDVENFRYWETKGRIYYNWGDYESQLSDINEEENVAFYDKYEDALEILIKITEEPEVKKNYENELAKYRANPGSVITPTEKPVTPTPTPEIIIPVAKTPTPVPTITPEIPTPVPPGPEATPTIIPVILPGTTPTPTIIPIILPD